MPFSVMYEIGVRVPGSYTSSYGRNLTLYHMASEELFTIWQGGQLAIPVRTTLAKVKTIRGAYYTRAMPCSCHVCLWY
jgi:hypothetical protein